MYLIRMLAGAGRMRDGVGLKAPMKDVTDEAFVLFDNLPAGLTEHGGPGVEVKYVQSEADAKKYQELAKEQLGTQLAARQAHKTKVKAKIAAWKAQATSNQAEAAEVVAEQAAAEKGSTAKAKLSQTTPAKKPSRKTKARRGTLATG